MISHGIGQVIFGWSYGGCCNFSIRCTELSVMMIGQWSDFFVLASDSLAFWQSVQGYVGEEAIYKASGGVVVTTLS